MKIKYKLIRKNLNEANQCSNFLEGILSDRVYVENPMQFKGEGQFQHLKLTFFIKDRPIYILNK